MTKSKTIHKGILDKSGNLNISLGRAATIRAVLSSLQTDPTLALQVKHVSVANNKRSKHALTSNQELRDLFEEIGRRCPNLETLRAALESTGGSFGCGAATVLPVSALTSFFQQSPRQLISLKLSGAISGTDREFVELEAAVREKAPNSWKEVRLEFCEPSPDTASLNPLLAAFSCCGTLQQVTLSGTNIYNDSNLCTGPSLLKLMARNELKVLTIWGGKRILRKEDTLALVQALEGDSSLKELTLHARGLCPIVGKALSHSLKTNSTLERLILSVSDTRFASANQGSKISNYVTTTTLLADTLRLHNRALKLLSMDYSIEEGDTSGDSLDYDFHEYHLIDTKASQWRDKVQAVSKAFTHMLHSNHVLEVLWMNLDNAEQDDENLADGFLTSEMDMLLRLNRYGIRQRLFENQPTATNQEWVQALESQRDDVNALFFLLSRSPGFCCSASPRGNKREAPNMHCPRKRLKTVK